MDCGDLVSEIGGLLAVRCEHHDEDNAELILPIQGLDGYNVRFWISKTNDGWSLSDDGHLTDALWGVKRSDVASRIASVAGDYPIRVLEDGDLAVDLVGSTAVENSRILSTTIEAVITAWSLRLDQRPPDISLSTRARVAKRLSDLGFPYTIGHRVPGHSGFERYFDIAAGGAYNHLLRTTDSPNPQRLKQAAELYAFHASDIRAETFLAFGHQFLWTWNSEYVPQPDPRVLGILAEADIAAYPSGNIDAIVEGLAG